MKFRDHLALVLESSEEAFRKWSENRKLCEAARQEGHEEGYTEGYLRGSIEGHEKGGADANKTFLADFTKQSQ